MQARTTQGNVEALLHNGSWDNRTIQGPVWSAVRENTGKGNCVGTVLNEQLKALEREKKGKVSAYLREGPRG